MLVKASSLQMMELIDLFLERLKSSHIANTISKFSSFLSLYSVIAVLMCFIDLIFLVLGKLYNLPICRFS